VKYYRDHFAALTLLSADGLWFVGIATAAILMQCNKFPDRDTSLLSRESPHTFWVITGSVWFLSLWLNNGYRMPRRWSVTEAVPVALRAFLWMILVAASLLFVLRIGVVPQKPVLIPSYVVAGVAWSGLFCGAILFRLLAGYVQLAVYRTGWGVRRALVIGDGMEAEQLVARIRQNPWLGEEVIGCVGNDVGVCGLRSCDVLADVVRQRGIDVLWLVVKGGGDAPPTLPTFLFAPEGNRLLWRILPDHFMQLVETTLSALTLMERETVDRRLRRDIALPSWKVAMIGSRGVPANYGGVETYVEEVGSALVASGARVTVYCHKKYVSARRTYKGMTLRFVPTLCTKHLEAFIHTLLASLHVLLHDDDIVHYHASGPSTLSWIPRLFGRFVVVTVQGLDWQRAKWGPWARLYLRFGEWTAIHCPHRTIVVSRTLVEYYTQRYGTQPVYIPNGVLPPQDGVPQQLLAWGLVKDSYVLFVGRLVPEKGCHTLLRAFTAVQTDKQLMIAGQATYEDGYLAELQAEAQKTNRIHFVGFVDKNVLRELYTYAYIVVHPSELEGLSISLLEARSYGNCLLVSDTPENREAMLDAGYIFRAGDSTDLARQLQWLIDTPEAVMAIRKRASGQKNGLLSWQEVAQATAAVYNTFT
jgi:glycosyltransferase involved in cell wall biosynthesis